MFKSITNKFIRCPLIFVSITLGAVLFGAGISLFVYVIECLAGVFGLVILLLVCLALLSAILCSD